MARLPDSAIRAMSDFRFRVLVEDLQVAYAAAVKGVLRREIEIEEMARAELGISLDDPWPEPEGTEEDPIADLYDHAGELEKQAKRALPIITKAFVISLFHAWERHMNARFKSEKYQKADVESSLTADDNSNLIHIIELLQLCANCAKHGPGDSGRRLFRKRPDLFPGVQTPDRAGEATLVISETLIAEFFNAVLAAVHWRAPSPSSPSASTSVPANR